MYILQVLKFTKQSLRLFKNNYQNYTEILRKEDNL